MKKRLVWAVIDALFLSQLSVVSYQLSAVWAQAPVGGLAVTGQVRGESGDPKSFVRVQLEGPGSYVALTNSKGQFSLKGVVPGQYRITVTQSGKVQTFTMPIERGQVDLVVKW